jgi:hypothetical protein
LTAKPSSSGLTSLGFSISQPYTDNIEGTGFDNEAKSRVGCYVIGDDRGQYPESRQAKTPDEFKALPFIDGKTIIECFDELHFYDD